MKVEEIDIDKQIGEIGEILDDNEKKRGIMIQALQHIQKDIGYLPEDVIRNLSESLNISMSEIYCVASFYKMFHFKPRGAKIVKVCLGTACYVRGSKKVLNTLGNEFKVNSGETTEDLTMTLETVGCVGCCGLAPITTINDEVVGEIIGNKKLEELIRYIKEDRKTEAIKEDIEK